MTIDHSTLIFATITHATAIRVHTGSVQESE